MSADLGSTLSPSLLQDPPSELLLLNPHDETLVLEDDEQPANLVVAMTDPDAPSPSKPKNSNFCHWLYYTHKKRKSGRIVMKELVKYMPPAPPRGTGKHRYLIVVMVPKNGSQKKLKLGKPASRKRWGYKHKREGLREWMTENDMVPIGKCLYSVVDRAADRSSGQLLLFTVREAEKSFSRGI